MENLWIIFLCIGIVLIIAEIMTGSLYLIALASGAFGAAAFVGSGIAPGRSILLGCLIAMALVVAVRAYRKKITPNDASVDDPDIGATVEVLGYSKDGLVVSYRGARWDARAGHGLTFDPGARAVIRAREGNLLLVEPESEASHEQVASAL